MQWQELSCTGGPYWIACAVVRSVACSNDPVRTHCFVHHPLVLILFGITSWWMVFLGILLSYCTPYCEAEASWMGCLRSSMMSKLVKILTGIGVCCPMGFKSLTAVLY